MSALEDFLDLVEATGSRSEALDVLWAYAKREDWARRQVARAGKNWDTHMAKFSGAVVPR